MNNIFIANWLYQKEEIIVIRNTSLLKGEQGDPNSQCPIRNWLEKKTRVDIGPFGPLYPTFQVITGASVYCPDQKRN